MPGRGPIALRPLLLAALLATPFGLVPSTQACRYNVRDLGFVDLGDNRSTLCLLVDDTVASAESARLARLAESVLEDANLSVETVHRGRDPGHAAWQHLAATATGALPAGVLVFPDQTGLELWSAGTDPGWVREAAERFASVVDSPLRSKLLEQLVSAYAVVVLVEGRDDKANLEARSVIAEAVRRIEAGLPTLPKAIAHPPTVLTCDPAARAREAVLLASLGLNPGRIETPQVAVVYGRARRLGPLLQGADLTATRLADLLSVIGVDCECGLDLAATRGTSLPVRWGTAVQVQAARALGFDPENPMVKAEAHRIVAGQGAGVRRAPGEYREIALREDHSPAAGGSDPRPRSPATAPHEAAHGTPGPSGPPQGGGLLGAVLWTTAGLSGVVLVVGGLLWRRSRRTS